MFEYYAGPPTKNPDKNSHTEKMESRHISVWINRPAIDVYRYAADPRHLSDWAAGLELGVLDHVVTLPSGEQVYNPFRVLPAGQQSSEVVFTLRRGADMTDAEFETDAAAVARDLMTLKRILEQH